MHDAFLVRRVQRVRDVARDPQGLSERHRATVDARGERVTLHELEHQGTAAAALFEAEDGGDVRMTERGQHARLAGETGHAVGIAGHRLGEDLDGHVTVKGGVASAIDLAHAARPDGVDDLVRPDLCPCGQHPVPGRQSNVNPSPLGARDSCQLESRRPCRRPRLSCPIRPKPVPVSTPGGTPSSPCRRHLEASAGPPLSGPA